MALHPFSDFLSTWRDGINKALKIRGEIDIVGDILTTDDYVTTDSFADAQELKNLNQCGILQIQNIGDNDAVITGQAWFDGVNITSWQYLLDRSYLPKGQTIYVPVQYIKRFRISAKSFQEGLPTTLRATMRTLPAGNIQPFPFRIKFTTPSIPAGGEYIAPYISLMQGYYNKVAVWIIGNIDHAPHEAVLQWAEQGAPAFYLMEEEIPFIRDRNSYGLYTVKLNSSRVKIKNTHNIAQPLTVYLYLMP